MPQRAPALFAAMATVFCGCGYTSTYTPPDGWRARPLYNGNEVVMVGSTELPECVTGDAEVQGGGEFPPRMMLDADGYWVPAPRVHVVFWGPVFLPPPFMFHPPGPHNLILGSLLKSSGGGGGGSGKGAGMVLAFAAALAVVASSGVAIGLAADPPEDDDDVAEGIDQVNLHNDRVRERIAECIRLAEARRASSPTPAPAPAPASAPSPAPAPASAVSEVEIEAPAPSPDPAPTPASSALSPADPHAPSLRAAPPAGRVGHEGDPAAPPTTQGSSSSSTSDEEVPW